MTEYVRTDSSEAGVLEGLYINAEQALIEAALVSGNRSCRTELIIVVFSQQVWR